MGEAQFIANGVHFSLYGFVLTDEELVEVLQQKGYKVARRTVAKYREQLNIPIARLRKEL